MLAGLASRQTSRRLSEVMIPLADLQDVGERYAPSVLREYFLYNGFNGSSQPMTVNIASSDLEFPYRELRVSKLYFLKKIWLLNVPAFQISLIVAAILLGSQPVDLDPVTLQYSVENFLPKHPSLVVLTYGFLATVLGELIGCYSLTPSNKRSLNPPLKLIFWLSGLINRSSIIFDLLAFVTIFKFSQVLTFVSLPLWLVGSVITFLVPLRTSVSLIRGRGGFFSITAWDGPQPVDLAADSSRDAIPNSVAQAVTSGSNFSLLYMVVHACAIADWQLLYMQLLADHCTVPDQTDLILVNSAKSYGVLLGYTLLLMPIKVFFVYDYGMSPLVFGSIIVSSVAAILSCMLNVLPLNRKSVNALMDELDAQDEGNV